MCYCHHRKQPILISKFNHLCSKLNYLHFFTTETEVLPPQQDVMPVISNNPAYDKVVMMHKAGCTDSNTKESLPDYEDIEELYFKKKVEVNDNTIEDDYI